MTHCGTFQLDDLLVSCVTEIIENGFESKLVPEVIQAWICKKLVQSMPKVLIDELLKALLESRDSEETLTFSNSVIKDQSGFKMGLEVRMKVFKNVEIKNWHEKTTEQDENNDIEENKNSDLNNPDSSELFDNNTHFMVPPFFCEEMLSDRHQEIPLKQPALRSKQKYSLDDTPHVTEDPALTSKIQNSTKTVTPAIMLHTEFLETQNSCSDNEYDEAAVGTTEIPERNGKTGRIEIKPLKHRSYCDFCDYSCARRHTLIKHQKKNHPVDFELMRGNKRYILPKPQTAKFGKFDPRICCVECDFIFKKIPQLSFHQKNCHPDFWKTARMKKRSRFDESVSTHSHYRVASHKRIYTREFFSAFSGSLPKIIEFWLFFGLNSQFLLINRKPQILSIKLILVCSPLYLKCQMCSETFNTETELDEHQQKLHAEYYQLKKTYEEMELDAMKCQICGSQHKSRRDLKVHMQTHTGDYKYRCDHCDIGFTKNHLLKNHLVKHTGEYPYRCRICEKGFRCLKEYLEHSESRHPKLHQELLEKQKIAEKRFGLNWGKKFHDYMKSSVGVVYD